MVSTQFEEERKEKKERKIISGQVIIYTPPREKEDTETNQMIR